MKTDKAIRKILKFIPNAKLEGDKNRIFVTIPNSKYIGRFITTNGEDDYCHNWHIRDLNNRTDTMTDYFAGHFERSCTAFIDCLLRWA